MNPPPLQTTDDTVLPVPGLRTPFRALHLTDTHLFLTDEDDADDARRENCLRRCQQWKGSDELAARFERVLTEAAPSYDLLLLTGDIVDFPSRVALARARAALDACGLPWFYIGGNHDWCFPGEYPDAALRARHYPLLAPLFQGRAPSVAYRAEFGGVQFLAIDDTNYQIDAGQLAFARETLAMGQPTVLLTHIPLWQAGLEVPVTAKWGAPILLGGQFTPEQLAKWPVDRDDPATAQFLGLLRETPHLLAILSGHVHFGHAEAFGHAVQYVGKPGFDLGANGFRFVPG